MKDKFDGKFGDLVFAYCIEEPEEIKRIKNVKYDDILKVAKDEFKIVPDPYFRVLEFPDRLVIDYGSHVKFLHWYFYN